MPKGMQPIFTYNLGASGSAVFSWNNIPQNYTDLMLLISMRSTGTLSTRNIGAYFNNTGYPGPANHHFALASGSSITQNFNTGFMALGVADDANSTSAVFSSHKIYIPNYTSTMYKQVMFESVAENNASTAYSTTGSVLWKQNTPVISMQFDLSGETMLQHSSFTLYGISR